MAAITFSEDEVVRDASKLLAHLRAGEDVVIESDAQPALTIRSVHEKDASIDATLERLRKSAEALGYEPVMDEDFAADMRAIVANRKPRDTSAWD